MRDSDWEILYELYRNPNMTKVANLLYITQPSLTKRLQNMETEFQVRIVNRTTKGLEFTEEGSYLAERARIYLDFMKETQAGLDELKEKNKASITIGSSYTYSKYTLAEVLFHYNREHPDVKFNVITEQSNVLFRQMLEGTIDVGFIRGDYEGAVNRALIDENQAYLVTREPVEDLSELASMQRLDYKTNDKTRELLHGWWQDRFHTEPPAAMMVGYIDFAWQIIHKGLGYTCCFLPHNFENQYNLCLTPLEYTDGSRVIRRTWFVYPKSRDMKPVLAQFVRYIEQEVALETE
ncbi:LysR family transcriptional regulator [Butyricicoccus sp.]|uniref:LysR family transcriptional regulator n=1 Tax=Butyricicoccus sp. TaxID=2049021 RepID=UPI003F17B61F